MQARLSFDIGSVDKREVLRYMGYRGQAFDESLDGRIDQGIAHAIDVSRPCGCIRIFDVAGRDADAQGRPRVLLEGTALELVGSSIARHLDGAIAVGVMAVTLSMANERELKRMSLSGDALDHVIFDAASTTLVERAADAAEAALIAGGLDRGLHANGRFSPGYGDLPLETQTPLLAALDAQRLLGISLSPALLMTPTKSVTAVLGLFEDVQPGGHHDCARCHCRDFCALPAEGRTCHE